MPTLARRRLLAGAACTAPVAFAARRGLAQTWPARPIRYVVPFAAGAGILDIMARIVARHLSEAVGQQVVVDNRPGPAALSVPTSSPRPSPMATRS